jgi:hypothetical protein
MYAQSPSAQGEPLLGSPRTLLHTATSRPWLNAAARLILCERFIYEFYDKIARFNFWRDNVAGSGFGSAASYLIAFIIVLLLLGVPCVVAGPLLSPLSKWRPRFIWGGLFCLTLFQLPTTIMFEGGTYEISSSVSILGGVILATCTSL